MNISIALCVVALVFVVLISRHRSPSMGLPVAYLVQLLLVHLPGAVAHAMPWSTLPFRQFTALGIQLTAIGALCFVAGVWMSRRKGAPKAGVALWPESKFLLFCLLGGWLIAFILTPFLVRIPTIGSMVDNGCKLWMIGIMMALPVHAARRNFLAVGGWLAAMLVFNVWLLIFGGFLAQGARAVLICLAPLIVMTKHIWKVWLSMALLTIAGMSIFVSYFLIRNDIREKVWGRRALEERWNESMRIVQEFQWIDFQNPKHLAALDERLNQNFFVGLSAVRLQKGAVEYRKGQTFVDGVIMLIPRAIWPDKPLTGGSPRIVAEMTGLPLAKGTSFGVGNVMEFYINFGMPSLVLGFLGMGWILGRLDYFGALAFEQGNYLRLISLILPAIALVQPENAFIEQVGGAAGGLLAAYFWCSLWKFLEEKAGRRV